MKVTLTNNLNRVVTLEFASPLCDYAMEVHDSAGNMATLIETSGPWDRPAARKLIAHGYVLAAADMRGTGASFGTWSECSDPASSLDGYDVNEWLESTRV